MNTTMHALSALLPLVDTTPTTLPSEDPLLTMLKWFGWIATTLGVIGLAACAIAMAIENRRSANEEAAISLGWLLALMILISSVGGIVGKFLSI